MAGRGQRLESALSARTSNFSQRRSTRFEAGAAAKRLSSGCGAARPRGGLVPSDPEPGRRGIPWLARARRALPGGPSERGPAGAKGRRTRLGFALDERELQDARRAPGALRALIRRSPEIPPIVLDTQSGPPLQEKACLAGPLVSEVVWQRGASAARPRRHQPRAAEGGNANFRREVHVETGVGQVRAPESYVENGVSAREGEAGPFLIGELEFPSSYRQPWFEPERPTSASSSAGHSRNSSPARAGRSRQEPSSRSRPARPTAPVSRRRARELRSFGSLRLTPSQVYLVASSNCTPTATGARRQLDGGSLPSSPLETGPGASPPKGWRSDCSPS